jgi:hypothetical protein
VPSRRLEPPEHVVNSDTIIVGDVDRLINNIEQGLCDMQYREREEQTKEFMEHTSESYIRYMGT